MRIAIGTLVIMGLLFAAAVHARWEEMQLRSQRALDASFRRWQRYAREHREGLENLRKGIAQVGVTMAQATQAFRAFSEAFRVAHDLGMRYENGVFVADEQHLWRGRPTRPPIGDVAYGVVDLERCWRCFAEIPREDDIGLCSGCKTELRDL